MASALCALDLVFAAPSHTHSRPHTNIYLCQSLAHTTQALSLTNPICSNPFLSLSSSLDKRQTMLSTRSVFVFYVLCFGAIDSVLALDCSPPPQPITDAWLADTQASRCDRVVGHVHLGQVCHDDRDRDRTTCSATSVLTVDSVTLSYVTEIQGDFSCLVRDTYTQTHTHAVEYTSSCL
jgi:hypothetical protein